LNSGEFVEVFNQAWVVLAVVVALIGYFLQQDSLVLIAAMILTIAPIGWLWNRLALRGVSYERYFSERRAFPGETIGLTIQVTNRKLLPVSWLQVQDEFPLSLPFVDHELAPSSLPNTGLLTHVFSLRWFDRVSRYYQIRCTQRGFFAVGPAHLSSGDLFGLFRSQRELSHRDWLIVYPRLYTLSALGLPAKEPFGEIRSSKRLFEDPGRTVGVRDHQPEDGFRRIHWKATARHQRLQTRVYEPTTSVNLILFLNVVTLPQPWHGVHVELLERLISVVASVAVYGIEHRYTVGLVANGCLPRSDQPLRILPSRSPDQLTRIMEALAMVTTFPTASIEHLLITESPRLPWGATLVIITGVVSEELRAALVQLREVGRQLALIALTDEPPEPLPGVLIYHLPEAATEPLTFDGVKDSIDARLAASPQ